MNFAAVAMALNDLGYRALGVRIDSGDLAYLSNIAREAFESVSKQFSVEWFASLIIVASNDINEDTYYPSMTRDIQLTYLELVHTWVSARARLKIDFLRPEFETHFTLEGSAKK